MGKAVDSQGGDRGPAEGSSGLGPCTLSQGARPHRTVESPRGCLPREDELGRKLTHLGLSLRAHSGAGASQRSRN